eukprot:TRINITY_DN63583_c0_g1_i1.p1 TRINITY_DN63583_c0_g1~~TRINITY_DN63583_c0_g1_i1.p1  ORF type:complete len:258 (-),score=39.75 TRINITY_DN63583_c0_g1_i1:135-908(-)
MKLSVLAMAMGCAVGQVVEMTQPSGGFLLSQESKRVVAATPVFAERWHMSFSEETSMRNMKFPFNLNVSRNTGSFHYDYQGRREVWVHGQGQRDNWCQCAGIDTAEECNVMSVPSAAEEGGGAMYLVFPKLERCCKVGPYAHGFGPLRPDWLRVANATRLPPKAVDTRTCTTFSAGPPGDTFMMISDDWSFDERGLPCTYSDHFKSFARRIFGLSHDIVFDASTYSEEVESEAMFALPSNQNCDQVCPNKEGWCSVK